MAPKATALRDGDFRSIDAAEVVPGDVLRIKLGEVVPAEGLGRFGLRASQHLPLNAYVPLDWLQQRLDRPGRVNALLAATAAAGRRAAPPSSSPPSRPTPTRRLSKLSARPPSR